MFAPNFAPHDPVASRTIEIPQSVAEASYELALAKIHTTPLDFAAYQELLSVVRYWEMVLGITKENAFNG